MTDPRVLKLKLKEILAEAQGLDLSEKEVSEKEVRLLIAKEPTDDELEEIENQYPQAS